MGLEQALEKGLPRAVNPRPRDSFNMLVLYPVEQITTALRRGDDFSAQSINDLTAFCNRVKALESALNERMEVLD